MKSGFPTQSNKAPIPRRLLQQRHHPSQHRHLHSNRHKKRLLFHLMPRLGVFLLVLLATQRNLLNPASPQHLLFKMTSRSLRISALGPRLCQVHLLSLRLRSLSSQLGQTSPDHRKPPRLPLVFLLFPNLIRRQISQQHRKRMIRNHLPWARYLLLFRLLRVCPSPLRQLQRQRLHQHRCPRRSQHLPRRYQSLILPRRWRLY